MKTNETVPVVVGVTGHRVLRGEDRSALRQAVRTELKKLQALCPHSPLVLLTSLAEGADLLRLVRDRSLPSGPGRGPGRHAASAEQNGQRQKQRGQFSFRQVLSPPFLSAGKRRI